MSKLRRYRRVQHTRKHLRLCGPYYLHDDLLELMHNRADCVQLLHQGTGMPTLVKDRIWRAAALPDTAMHSGSPMPYWTRRYLAWWLLSS